MAYEMRPGQGNLFKNDQKGNEKAPGYRGEILTPDGELLEIAAWVKEGKKGKFFSLSVKPKQARPQEPRKAEPQDDCPF